MLEAVPHRSNAGALRSARARATAVVGAVGCRRGAARVARWAARLAPDESPSPASGAQDLPRVVVPLVKPGSHGSHAAATSNYDVGDTMQQISGAVKA